MPKCVSTAFGIRTVLVEIALVETEVEIAPMLALVKIAAHKKSKR